MGRPAESQRTESQLWEKNTSAPMSGHTQDFSAVHPLDCVTDRRGQLYFHNGRIAASDKIEGHYRTENCTREAGAGGAAGARRMLLLLTDAMNR
jgi:hypothetical protein